MPQRMPKWRSITPLYRQSLPVKRLLLPFLILALASLATWKLMDSKPESQAIEVREQVWNVGVMEARPESLHPSLRLYGHVESPRLTRVTAAVNADVLEVIAREGDRVVEGGLLVRLDDAELGLVVDRRAADLARIEADIQTEMDRHASNESALPHERKLLALKRKAAQRARDLAKNKVGAQNALDEALQGVETQRLQLEQRELAIRQHVPNLARLNADRRRAVSLLEQARLDLARTQVRAPFDGVISRVPVSMGTRVNVGAMLVELFDTQALEVRVQVPSGELAPLRQAMARGDVLNAQAQVDGRPLRLVLRGLSGRVNDASGSVEAPFDITQGGQDLPLGRFMALDLRMPALVNVVALPPEAVYGRDRICLLDDDRMRSARVRRMGESRDARGQSRILVRGEALRQGARVITTQLPNAIDGLRVQAFED